MSSPATAINFSTTEAERLSWPMRRRQLGAVLRFEVKRNLFSRRAVLPFLLALVPIMVMAGLALIHHTSVVEYRDAGGHFVRRVFSEGLLDDPRRAISIFAGVYYELILRTILFFGCAWMFMNLFRGELVDRSLHYYFLVPVRREILLAGKYLSGLITAATLFLLTTAGSLLLLYWPQGRTAAMHDLLAGAGGVQALTYAGITVLACVGYGAVFLLIGLLFRNPVVPALIIYAWEFVNFLFPPILQKISVVHYLRSLLPVPLPAGQLAIVVEPTPAWISIGGLLVFAAVMLVIAASRLRQMQISYAEE